MAPLPKPPDRRQRTNARNDLGIIMGTGPANPPDAPDGLRSDTAAEWVELWEDPIAQTFKPAHMPALRRLFELRDTVRRYEGAVGEDLVVEGSKGQTIEHPLLKKCDTLRTQILALEDRFGLSPYACSKLGASYADAHRSIAEVNRRYAEGGASVDSDPRVFDASSRPA